MIAALYVAKDGCYIGLDGIDPWPADRDARQYAGPHPVVAHPPCDRWCQMAPVNQARYGHKVGDDGGCFAAALTAVRNWGGVLEHPAVSLAWPAFDLPRPPSIGGWVRGACGGWSAHIEQRNYGHRARKATWLYAYGVDLPSLKWGKGPAPEAWISADRPRAELAARGIGQLSKKEAKATPLPFRDLLISIARTAPNDPTMCTTLQSGSGDQKGVDRPGCVPDVQLVRGHKADCRNVFGRPDARTAHYPGSQRMIYQDKDVDQ